MKAEWRRVEEVFLSALEHSEENRAAFLQIACAGDAPLHEEVEAMLRSHGQAGDFIEQPAYQVNAELLVEETGALKIGELFSGYKSSLSLAKAAWERYTSRRTLSSDERSQSNW